MAANKIEAGNLTRRGRGRPKGSPNKTSKEAKSVIAEAAESLGGVKRIVAWAKEAPENERAFWATIYPKLVSITLGGDPNNPLVTEIRRIRVEP
jgi:phage tail sheath gpL-like